MTRSAVHLLRKNMLPSLVVSTTIVILTSAEGEESFEAMAIFLNVLAVYFICEIDDKLGEFLISSRFHEKHRKALEMLEKHRNPEFNSPVHWLENRIYAFTLSAASESECGLEP